MQKQNNNFIDNLINWSWIVILISSIFQFIFFQIVENTLAIICVIFAWLLVTIFFFRLRILQQYPLSTFFLIGYTSTQFYFPLVFTSIEVKPIIFNLEHPIGVFLHSLLALIVLIIVHTVYRFMFKPISKNKISFLEKVNFFDPPSDFQMWFMGFTGLGASFYVYLYSPSIGWNVTGSALDKFIQALIPFSYAPFFLPFSQLYGRDKKKSKFLVVLLVTFAFLLFLVGIGRNSRGAFMIGFISTGLAYTIGLLLGYFKPRFFTIKNIAIGVFALWLLTSPLADIGTAMVIVRGQRHDISYLELIEQTLEIFNDKESIRLYRSIDTDTKEKKEWDENYLNNIFLARFSNVKFNDASLIQAEKIGEMDMLMFNFSIDYAWATLPQPFLDVLGININKEMVKGVSIGDYLYYRASGSPEALGGYRTGSFAGTGMAAFGWWYLLILGVVIVPVYILMDKFSIQIHKSEDNIYNGKPYQQVRFSVCGLLILDSIFRFFPVESVVSITAFIFRDWIQLVTIYIILYKISNLLNINLKKHT